MSHTVQLLPIERADDVRGILRQTYGDEYYGADKAFFDWLYLGNVCEWFAPQAARGFMPVNAILDGDGAIQAVHAFIPFDAYTPWGGGKGVWDEEWINASGVRGLGRELATHLLAEADVYIGLGCNELSRNAFTKMGMEYIPELPRLVFHVETEKLMAAAQASGLADLEITADNCPFNDGAAFVTLARAEDIPENVLERYREETPLGAARSKAWLAWRYDRHPYIHYEVVALDEDCSRGVAIVRNEEVVGTEYVVCRITDLFTVPGHEADLIAAVIGYARSLGAVVVDYFSTSAMHIEALTQDMEAKGMLFASNPDHVPFMFQPIATVQNNSINGVFSVGGQPGVEARLLDFRSSKADSTQDILRNPHASGCEGK